MKRINQIREELRCPLLPDDWAALEAELQEAIRAETLRIIEREKLIKTPKY